MRSMAGLDTHPSFCCWARRSSAITADACRPSGYFLIWRSTQARFSGVKSKLSGWISARRRTVMTVPSIHLFAGLAATSVAQLLKDGYEIKTAFADPSGGAYIILQRASSAYLCHSSPRQTCEKMN